MSSAKEEKGLLCTACLKATLRKEAAVRSKEKKGRRKKIRPATNAKGRSLQLILKVGNKKTAWRYHSLPAGKKQR